MSKCIGQCADEWMDGRSVGGCMGGWSMNE